MAKKPASSTRRGHTKYWILAGVALTILAIIITMVIINANTPAAAPPEDQTYPSVSAAAAPPQAQAPVGQNLQAGQQELATAFISAFHSQGWEDPQPTTWLSRVSPFVTKQFDTQLKTTYGAAAGGAAWTEFVNAQTVRQGVLDTVQGNPENSSSSKAILIVSFHVEITSPSAPPTTEPLASKMLVLVKASDRWLVASFGEIAAGSNEAPSQTTAEPLPTVHD